MPAKPNCPTCQRHDAVKAGKKGLYCYRCKEVLPVGTTPQLVVDNTKEATPIDVGMEIIGAHAALMSEHGGPGRAYLTERGIHEDTMRAFTLGWMGGKVTLPVKSAAGEWINIRSCPPDGSLRGRYGRGTQLYPDIPKDGLVVICEGEWDCLLARSMGIPAITGTGGAGTWHPEWTGLLDAAGVKDAVIAYDADTAGKSGAAKVASSLSTSLDPARIRAVHWDPGEDLSDWVLKSGRSPLELMTRIAEARGIWETTEVVHDGEVVDRTLSGAIAPEQALTWSRFESSVESAGVDSHLLTTQARVECSKVSKSCNRCRFLNIPIPFTAVIDPRSPEFLDLIGPKQALDLLLRSKLGIPKGCPDLVITSLKHLKATEYRLIEEFHVAANEEPVVAHAVSIGPLLQPNHAYELVARTIPHPKNQLTTMLITEAKLAEDDLAHFVPNDELLQPLARGKKRIETKVGEILEDAEQITGIWDRPDLHLLLLMAYHSALWIKWDPRSSVHMRGWLDVLILGDSGQGKSTAAEGIRDWIDLGERAVLKSASRAGLLGGMTDVRGQSWITWGVDPRCDRRLAIYEEVKGTKKDVLAALTDARYSGIAEVVLGKGGRRKTFARTRRVWISNPRHLPQMAAYGYGVTAIEELFGAAEDVRRLDMALIVASGDVSPDLVNRDRTKDPAILLPDRLRESVLRAWAMAPVEPSEKAREAAKEAATWMSNEFVSRVPLVEGADHRQKLMRLAVALANLMQEEVSPAHVEYVANWQDNIYSAPGFGYREMSQGLIELEVLEDEAAVVRSLGPRSSNWRRLLRAETLAPQDFQDLYGMDDGMSVHAVLVRANAIVRDGREYRKTKGFIELLRRLIDGKR